MGTSVRPYIKQKMDNDKVDDDKIVEEDHASRQVHVTRPGAYTRSR